MIYLIKVRFKKWLVTTVIIILVVIAVGIYGLYRLHLLPSRSFTAKDFGIQTLKSQTDKNQNGIDDYKDILLGARAYVETKPKYNGAYYTGGYPPDGIGVCTDVIWKAFKNAGYSLKDLVDDDISNNRAAYPEITAPDKNIDFRRVKNLIVFFKRNAQLLTTNPNKIKEWQPGDIVIYPNHIAIVSDKRNRNGQPYIIHNNGLPVYEVDALTIYKIVGHYRWTK